ncbi:MAG: hypothetical protein C0606_15020 [Hyphomicrobiales bacterium]|nr:MAG: hypothetical protein C0606_15020 [Hyphomicrobiales bacterium]
MFARTRILSLLRPMTMALVVAAFSAAVSLAGAQPAAANLNEEQKEVLGKINDYFNGIRTMQGDFVQFAPNGSRTEGTFHLARPGKVRFEYAKPARMQIVADGESVAVVDTRLATQDVWPLNKTPLRFLLADHIDLTADAKITNVVVEPDLVTITIEEESAFGDGKLTLMFDGRTHELKQWTVTDAQGDTSVAIYNVETGKPASDKLFRINYRHFMLDRGRTK